MYVCIYLCIYVCMYVSIYLSICLCVSMYVCLCVSMYVCVCVFVYMYVCYVCMLNAQDEETCPWKFLYAWLNDFEMLPRQAWLILTSSKFFNLPKHYDNLGDADDGAVGHVDDGEPVGSKCPCQVKVRSICTPWHPCLFHINRYTQPHLCTHTHTSTLMHT